MAADGSLKVILAALIGNGLITISKFFGAVFTGSSAMLSEAIHSLVDTGNQALLLFGMKRAKKPANSRHPFGYGGEIYFWAFIVAILLFSIGAVVAIYEGWHKLHDPQPIKHIMVNYVVLSASFVFEGWAWWVAYKEFDRRRGSKRFFHAVRASKDPRVFTVLFEDTAAMLGLIIAMIGITASYYFNISWADGAASIAIGVILAVIAAILAYECKGLLIGEAASPEVQAEIAKILESNSAKAKVTEFLTIHFGPDDVLLTVSLDFQDDLLVQEVEEIISNLEQKLKVKVPAIKRVFIEVQDAKKHKASSPLFSQDA